MKVFQYLAALSVLSFASTASASLMFGALDDGISSLVYNEDTGNLQVEVEGGNIAFLQIDSASGIFTGDAANVPPGALPTDRDDRIGFAVFSGSFAEDDTFLDLGNILPAGLEIGFLAQDLTGSVNFDPPRQGGNVPLNIVGIPEPASLALVGLGIAGVVARRRRV